MPPARCGQSQHHRQVEPRLAAAVAGALKTAAASATSVHAALRARRRCLSPRATATPSPHATAGVAVRGAGAACLR
eukprot:366366-Chlamydomonas_euryale.AAC.25